MYQLYRILSGTSRPHDWYVMLGYVALATVGIVLMHRDPEIKNRGLWKDRPKLPFGRLSGLVLVSFGWLLAISFGLDRLAEGPLSEFSVSATGIYLAIGLTGVIIIGFVEWRNSRAEVKRENTIAISGGERISEGC